MHYLLFLFLLLPAPAYAKDVTLLGYVDAGKHGTSSAVFVVGDDEDDVKVVRVGQSIEGYKLVEVRTPGIVLLKDGKRFFVKPGGWNLLDIKTAPPPLKGLERHEDQIEVSSSLRDHVRDEGLITVMMQAASEPVLEGGNIVGYRLWDMDKGSVYEMAGFKNGDWIKEIDGIPLSGPLVALKALQTIRGEDDFTVLVNRNGIDSLWRVKVR